MSVRPKQNIRVEYPEETDVYYTQERLAYLGWIKGLGVLAILIAIGQIVLSVIHLINHNSSLTLSLLITGVFFLIGAILSVVWAVQTAKSYKASTELYQPKASDTLTKAVFIEGLLLACAACFLIVNLFMQSEYSADYVKAQEDEVEGNDNEDLTRLLAKFFIIQICIMGFYFFFFLLASRSAFRCLKWDNQAMSYLVFLGNVLLLAFALAILYYVERAFNYEEYPQLKAHFPVWNIRGLQYAAFALVVVSIITFFIDHRSWRVGFFVLAILMLILLVLLVNFTGFAFRHTRHTYEYYKGVSNTNTCIERMDLVHSGELKEMGCPTKYYSLVGQCNQGGAVFRWEGTGADNSGYNQDEQPNTETDTGATFLVSSDNASMYSCLNTNCCGLLGQLYSKHLLKLANFGLLAMLAGSLISIACYYFWYVSWVDTARDKKKDYIWLILMVMIIVAFVIIICVANPSYISERLGKDERHLEMLEMF